MQDTKKNINFASKEVWLENSKPPREYKIYTNLSPSCEAINHPAIRNRNSSVIMKKLTFAFAALIALASCSQTEPPEPPVRPDNPDPVVPEAKISPEQAQQAFLDAWGDFYPQTRSGEPRIASCHAYGKSLTPVTRSYEEPMIYVINLEDNAGFAIMAATPALPELIAISDKGNYSPGQTTHTGVDDFMGLLNQYMIANPDSLIEHPDTFAPFPGQVYTVNHPWQTTANIPAMCTVKWDDMYPFNQYCPKTGAIYPSAGSDAVAIAQAMSIFGKPVSYGGYTFDWSVMTAANPTNEAFQMIARLLEIIGCEDMAWMTYGRSFSTCELEDLMTVFPALGYADAVGFKSDNTTPQPYTDVRVRGELEANRPVIARGKEAGNNKPMVAWLIHGLLARQRNVEQRQATEDGGYIVLSSKTENQEYVLCNWGKFGEWDGYYLNSIMGLGYNDYIPEGDNTTPSGVTNYTNDVHIITKIYPTQ